MNNIIEFTTAICSLVLLNKVKEVAEKLDMYEFQSFILGDCNHLIQSTNRDEYGDIEITCNDGSKLVLQFVQDMYEDEWGTCSKMVEYCILHDFEISHSKVVSNQVIWG